MAAKGTAAKSASGASMSKYDVEVEKRLKALEAEAHPKCHHDTEEGDIDRLSALEAKVNKIISHLSKKEKDLMEFYGWNRSQLHKKLIIDRHNQIIRYT